MRVLLDASVLRHSIDRRIIARGIEKTITRGGKDITVPLTRWREEHPGEKTDRELRKHIRILPLIAHAAKRRQLELFVHAEILVEYWGHPGMPDTRGIFQGAPISTARDPVRYSRVIVGGSESADELQASFLAGLGHPRFLELQHVTGANNLGPRRRNALADAFHLWTAEAAGMDCFLTTDMKLVRAAATNRPQKPRVRVVTPVGLTTELLQRRHIRVRDAMAWAWFYWRARGAGPKSHPFEQLLELSQRLDRADGL